MKITGIRITRGADAGSRAREATSASPDAIVELLTDAEIIGFAGLAEAACVHAERVVAGLLVDTDPRGATGAWQRMTEAASSHGRGVELQAAIAALDIALWDLKAKFNGEPLWKTLGGARPHAKAHASVPKPAHETQMTVAWAEQMALEFGLSGGKLRLGLDASHDAERLDALRTALQQAAVPATLAVDLERYGTAKESIRRVRALEAEFDIAWIEGAAQDWDFPGLKQVSEAVRAAVSVGRRLATRGEFLPHFHHRSAQVIDIDVGLTGITGALLLADAAYGYELPVTLASSHGNFAAHLAAVMPYIMSIEIIDPSPVTPLCLTDMHVAGGHVIAGDAPGHGLRMKRDASPAGGPS